MFYSPLAVPEKWQSAYESHTRAVEQKIVGVAAWLLLFSVIIYQFSHDIRQSHGSDFWALELAFRTPVILVTLIALCTRYVGWPRCTGHLLLRLMGLSLMFMILSLLLLHLKTGSAEVHRISNGLVISFFGVSILSVRGFRDWPLLFALPLAVFAMVAVYLGITLDSLAPLIFDPLMMMVIGMIVMAAFRHLLTSEFLARQQLREVASTDQLTGLLTRHAMRPLLDHERQRARRAGSMFSVILGDLDLFKRVNDTWGHDTGDLVLHETARRLGATLRRQDALCRWGGEELLALLPDTDAAGAREVAEKLRQAMLPTIDARGQPISQTISLGVASFEPEETVDALVGRADEALYLAKRNGRNRVEVAGAISG